MRQSVLACNAANAESPDRQFAELDEVVSGWSTTARPKEYRCQLSLATRRRNETAPSSLRRVVGKCGDSMPASSWGTVCSD